MINTTQARLEAAAHNAGWDSFTLLLLISRWLEDNGHADALVGHLEALAEEEDEISGPDGLPMTLDEIVEAAKAEGYTVSRKAVDTYVFNDPDGNDADNGPWETEGEAWKAAYRDFGTV